MESKQTLSSETLLAILQAHDPTVRRRLDHYSEHYSTLMEFGWSHDDILTAFQTGYPYWLHTQTWVSSRKPHHRLLNCWHWRHGHGSDLLYEWLEQRYRRMHAREAGFSFDEFVGVWRQLATDTLLRQKYPRSEPLCQLYVRAIGAGIKAHEVHYILTAWFPHNFMHWSGAGYREVYIELRKKLSRQLTESIMFAHLNSADSNRGPLVPKNVLKALKYGATQEQLFKSVADGSVLRLAVKLRRPSPA